MQAIRDAVLAGVAFWLAYLVRFSFPEYLPHETTPEPSETTAVLIMVMVVWPALGWASGLYVSRRARGVASEIFDVFRVTVVAFLVLVTVTYFVRDVRYSRATLLFWSCLAFGMISVVRVGARVFLQRLRSHGFNLRHVVVVGDGRLAQRVIDAIHDHGAFGLRLVGMVARASSPDGAAQDRVTKTRVLGTVDELPSILDRYDVDQVIVALPVDELGALKGIMELLSRETVDVRLVPDFYQYMTLCGSVEEFGGMPIINLQATPLMGWNLVTKRAFDLVVAGIAFILAAPVLLVLAVAIKLTSAGPVFFRQQRVGLDGRAFTMYKLRTMCIDAEQGGAAMTTPGDPRRTSLGAFLRHFSLDELPQLWNVLRGDMSLVGPRPEQPAFIDDFKREIPRYALRHKIRAGMTGWAQINGMRGRTSISKRIELDLYYIENWSLFLDFKILLRTLFGGFLSPNAY